MTIVGTIGGTGWAAANNSSGTLTHTGTATATATTSAIAGGSASQNTYLTGPFVGTAQGVVANNAFRWRWVASVGSSYMTVPNSTATGYKNLYTADYSGSGSGQPSAANVRSGTVYGPSSELTGTCAVPGASSVASGVPIDATTGTAVLTAAALRSAMGLASANLDTQLAAISTTAAPSAAAIRTEMDANSTKLANLDATVSSRSTYAGADTSGTTTLLSRLTSGRAGNLDNLDATVSSRPSAADIATAVWAAATRTLTTAIDNSATIAAAVWSYATGRTITGGTVDTLTSAPSVPSAATIASQVRTELSTELARIDVATSTRLAPAGTLARVTLTDTATTLTNAPTVPTTSQIASQVRTELAVELARIDATISSRLAAVSYTAAPTTAAIRTELSTELARIDAAVSTRLAPGGTLARVTLTDTATTLTSALSVPSAATIASQVRTELQPELARMANAATTQEVADLVQEAIQP